MGMKFIAVDDETLSLRQLERRLKRLYPDCEVITADNYIDVLVHAKEKFTAAFLDVEMPGMDGISLAKELQRHDPYINIVFVTAYDSYALEAYRLMASGYLTKPYSTEDLQRQIDGLRFREAEVPAKMADAAEVTKPKLTVRCFGYFEVFKDGQPLHFSRQSSKEIFAYLVHLRGSSVDRETICAAMWEDSAKSDKRKGYFRSLITSLRETLREYDAEDVFINQYNSYAINRNLIDCDYYRYLNGEDSPKAKFRGEYMTQYSWGEETLGSLLDMENII